MHICMGGYVRSAAPDMGWLHSDDLGTTAACKKHMLLHFWLMLQTYICPYLPGVWETPCKLVVAEAKILHL